MIEQAFVDDDEDYSFFYLADPKKARRERKYVVQRRDTDEAIIRGRREDVQHYVELVNDYKSTGNPESNRKAEIVKNVALERLLEFKRLRKVQEMANREVRMAKPVFSARTYNLPPITLPPIDFGDAPAAAAGGAAVPAGGAGGPSKYVYEAEKHDGVPSGLEGASGGSGRAYGGRRRKNKGRKTRSKSRQSRSRSRKSRRSRA